MRNIRKHSASSRRSFPFLIQIPPLTRLSSFISVSPVHPCTALSEISDAACASLPRQTVPSAQCIKDRFVKDVFSFVQTQDGFIPFKSPFTTYTIEKPEKLHFSRKIFDLYICTILRQVKSNILCKIRNDAGNITCFFQKGFYFPGECGIMMEYISIIKED